MPISGVVAGQLRPRRALGWPSWQDGSGVSNGAKWVNLDQLNRKSGQGRDRTGDTWIFSPLLYQLSYLTSLFGLSAERESEFT